MDIVKTNDSAGDRIFEVVKGREKIAMFRNREEAEFFIECRKAGRSFSGMKLRSINNSRRGILQ